MASFRKRKNSWEVSVARSGIRKSASFSTKAEAEAWALELEAEIKSVHGKKPGGIRYSRTLLSEEEIIAKSQSTESTCGIYFLILHGRVVYVGKSVDVYFRIADHRARGRKFSHFSITPCHPKELTKIESQYILSLAPDGNRSKSGKLIISINHEKLQNE